VSLSGRAFVNRAAAVSAFGFNPSRKRDLGALPLGAAQAQSAGPWLTPPKQGSLRPHQAVAPLTLRERCAGAETEDQEFCFLSIPQELRIVIVPLRKRL
jgi:hypothetical protein